MALEPAAHTPSVFLVMKQRWRDYLASGTAVTITINNIANSAAATTLTVGGTVTAAPGVVRAGSATVRIMQGGVERARREAPTVQATGVYTTTFPPIALPAAAGYTAVVTVSYSPPVTSNTFLRTP